MPQPRILPDPIPPDAQTFRDGMSRVAGAVHVVTTDGPAGRAGFTATAVAPVTDSPPVLLVCVNSAGRSGAALLRNRAFCVSTLAAGDEALAEAFAGRSGLQGLERFAAGTWTTLETGAPALDSALVSFDCRVRDATRLGTHDVIFGDILRIRLGQARPALVYAGRAYRRI